MADVDPIALGTLVAVDWIDAHASVTREQTLEDIATEEPAIYTTYGILVRNDAQFVAVAGDVREAELYRGVSYIPRGMVTKIISKQRSRKRKILTPPTTAG
jgi:hypothetical protein